MEEKKTEYEEFRITVVDPNQVEARKPNSPKIYGNVQRDPLRERTIKVLERWLVEGNLKDRNEFIVLGSHLYETLFEDKISDAFKNEFDKWKKDESTLLRLVLEFHPDAGELGEMPWEYLYYPDRYNREGVEPGFFLATHVNLVLTRTVRLKEPEELDPEDRPLRILVVISEPEDEAEVTSEGVCKAIGDLQELLPDALEVKHLVQPTREDFIEKMKDLKPHVLHFVGHGQYEEGEGSLALVSDQGEADWIADVDLTDCFMEARWQPRVVFLDVCKGARSDLYRNFKGVALSLVHSGVSAVVAMQHPIENQMASSFAEKFYQSLGDGKPIDVAVQAARLHVAFHLKDRNYSDRDFGSPVVYLQTGKGRLLSAQGIILAERIRVPTRRARKPPPPDVVDCPYSLHSDYVCRGKVRRSDIKEGNDMCPWCNHKLMECPDCSRIIDEEIGRCICGFDKRRVIEKAPTERPEERREREEKRLEKQRAPIYR